MVNVNKLRGKIVELGLTTADVAEKMGIDRSTLYRKLNEPDEGFTVKEVADLAKILNLTANELNTIFFAHIVA